MKRNVPRFLSAEIVFLKLLGKGTKNARSQKTPKKVKFK